MLDKIELIEIRLNEIDQELLRTDLGYQAFADLGKERSEIEPVVLKGREYRSALQELEDARMMADGDDPELVELAELEIPDIDGKL